MGLKNVSRRHPCPICNKGDWCSIRDDGKLVVCNRISEGSIKPGRKGFIHILPDYSEPIPKKKIASFSSNKHPNHLKPDLSLCNLVYTELLTALILIGAHADNLLERGLSENTITQNLYASVPKKSVLDELVCNLSVKYDLSCVPGFFFEKDKWHFITGQEWWRGFFVPYRNHQGHIQGLQVRRDNGDPRYIWVSSANNNGTSPGSPIHFAKPWIADLTQFAIITEGALKGDSIAEYLEQTVIAIAGVSSFSEFIGERLHQELPNLKTLAIAFDNDWRTKPQVKDQLLRLIEILEKDRFQVKVLDWKEAKGLDDLLRLAESEEK